VAKPNLRLIAPTLKFEQSFRAGRLTPSSVPVST
jgi:hypothetical protein